MFYKNVQIKEILMCELQYQWFAEVFNSSIPSILFIYFWLAYFGYLLILVYFRGFNLELINDWSLERSFIYSTVVRSVTLKGKDVMNSWWNRSKAIVNIYGSESMITFHYLNSLTPYSPTHNFLQLLTNSSIVHLLAR